MAYVFIHSLRDMWVMGYKTDGMHRGIRPSKYKVLSCYDDVCVDHVYGNIQVNSST